MKILQTSKGFTLIELMIAMAISGLIIAGIITSKIGQQDQHLTQVQAVEMQQSVRAVMSLMKQELRMAGYNPYSPDYGEGISAANANDLTFSYVADDDCTDNDGDSSNPGDCTDPDVDEEGELEIIAYAFGDPDGDGDNDITISFNGAGAQIIAENIRNLGFICFDASGVPIPYPIADLTAIKSIQITITVTTDVDELARATNNTTRTLTTTVYLRNMGI
jgi:type IV pilus assembly protein PilW